MEQVIKKESKKDLKIVKQPETVKITEVVTKHTYAVVPPPKEERKDLGFMDKLVEFRNAMTSRGVETKPGTSDCQGFFHLKLLYDGDLFDFSSC